MDSTLVAQLNDFDARKRRNALAALLEQELETGDPPTPSDPSGRVNLHCHTFFSFNGYGYSPTYIALRARREGLLAAGIVDFDVLDGVDEFLEAARLLDLRCCAGLETRVFVPAFADRVINSPGEPGIAYHMGAGFTTGRIADPGLLTTLRSTAQKRNQLILDRINPVLAPLTLDYPCDVLPLTPNGNATERHLCIACETKAQALLPDDAERAAFWAGKLGSDSAKVQKLFGDPPAFQGLIRSKLMKAGGPGYVKPEGTAFPPSAEVNAFIQSAGAIPTLTWLDGTSPGEEAIEELLEVMVAEGVAAVNIIPDRNWNIADPATKAVKVAKLHAFVALAESRDLPILVGTEMNAHGQRFVDDFDAPEMKPLGDAFRKGALILWAHTLLQDALGMGYLSDWASSRFSSAREKNTFFAELGALVSPARANVLNGVTPDSDPEALLNRARSIA